MKRGSDIGWSVVLIVALLGLGLWWTLRPVEPPTRPYDDIGEVSEGADALPARMPTLPRGRPVVQHEIAALRGKMPSVEGVVRRLGRPIAARVEAYALASPSESVPIAWSDPGQWIRRMDPVPAASPAATGSADADGRYRLDGLSRGLYRLAAITDDGARGNASVEIGVGTVEQDIEVAAGAFALKGHVKDAAGKAWRGTVRAVHAWDFGSLNQPVPGDAPLVATDEAGAFSIAGLDAGRYVVQAEITGTLRVDGLNKSQFCSITIWCSPQCPSVNGNR